MGTKKNYNIIISINYEEKSFFPKLTFYWSDNLLDFSPLPVLKEEERLILANNNGYLTGEHDKLVHLFEENEEFLDLNDFDQIVQRGNKKGNLKEIHLVSYLVNKITEESAVFPRNAFFLNFNNNLDFERNFRFLKKDSEQFQNYLRFRDPKKEKVDYFLALRDKQNVTLFEDISQQKNEFNLSSNFIGNKKWIKSLLWPGFVNYSITNSSYFGFIYFGYGLRNNDLEFILNN